MLGYLEMLLDGALGDVSAPQDDALRRTQQYALGLLEMITAVLDLNRVADAVHARATSAHTADASREGVVSSTQRIARGVVLLFEQRRPIPNLIVRHTSNPTPVARQKKASRPTGPPRNHPRTLDV